MRSASAGQLRGTEGRGLQPHPPLLNISTSTAPHPFPRSLLHDPHCPMPLPPSPSLCRPCGSVRWAASAHAEHHVAIQRPAAVDRAALDHLVDQQRQTQGLPACADERHVGRSPAGGHLEGKARTSDLPVPCCCCACSVLLAAGAGCGCAAGAPAQSRHFGGQRADACRRAARATDAPGGLK